MPESIIATFEIDVLGLRERWLVGNKPEPLNEKEAPDEKKQQREEAFEQNKNAQRFLLALALWKIRQFLADQPSFDARTGQVERSLRLRSDCGLKLIDRREGQHHPLQYRTQSNGAAFDPPVDLALSQLVTVAQGQVRPLEEPPDFKPLVKDIAGTDDIEIEVVWGKPPTEPEGPASTAADEGDDEEADGDSDGAE